MKPRPPPPAGADRSSEPERDTGLPWPRSWPGVYLLVVAVFAVWVTLLAAFMRAFA